MVGLVPRVVTSGSQTADVGTGDGTGAAGSTPTRDNKHLAALATGADGSLACSTAIGENPAVSLVDGGYVGVAVNGQLAFVGDGTKNADCYFSRDGGVTALAMQDIKAGDLLYWNATIAGFQLVHDTDVSNIEIDRIDFLFNVP